MKKYDAYMPVFQLSNRIFKHNFIKTGSFMTLVIYFE